MLKVPSFAYFPEFRVTAYQDDTTWWKFYLIPDYISVRKDINDNPVFLLVKYAFGDQDRNDNPELPTGGGFMVFDTEMRVEEMDMTAIRAALQIHVDDMHAAMLEAAENHHLQLEGMHLSSWSYVPRRTDVEYEGGLNWSVETRGGHYRYNHVGTDDLQLGLGHDIPPHPGETVPTVIIDYPTWTEGTFRVQAPQSDALIAHAVSEGPLSLVGNNVASVAIDLTSAGATFMEKTLSEDGLGATDTVPIQVVYQLKFWARIPPVRLKITADSRSLYESITEITHSYDDDGCDEDDMSHEEKHLQSAVDSGMIKVEFDTGTLDLSDDFVQSLHSTAMDIVGDLVKENFFNKETREREETPDYTGAEMDIYYRKEIQDFSSVHFEYNETVTSIVEWDIAPQGTLQAFLTEVDDISEFVRTVDLDDDFFKSLDLTVAAYADWDNEPIAYVEVEAKYEGEDENGNEVSKVHQFTLNKENPLEKWENCSLIGGKREYEWRSRIVFVGREAPEWPRKFTKDTTPRLNISVADPGKIAIHVLAGNLDFEQNLRMAQVDLKVDGEDADVTTLLFTGGIQERSFERYIYEEWTEPVEYRVRAYLRTGQVIEGDWEDTISGQLLVNEPFYDRLDVQLVPTGDWDDVVQCVVSMRYEDSANDFNVDAAFSLKSLGEFRQWSVPLIDTDRRRFTYQHTTTFKDGSFHQTEWLKGESDGALPIIVSDRRKLEVNVLPQMLNFAVTPMVTCTLQWAHGDAVENETYAFSDDEKAPKTWSFRVPDDAPLSYTWQARYHLEDRTDESEETRSEETQLVVPRLKVPTVACQVVPTLVNLTKTPVVEVNLEYEDSANELFGGDTIVFDSGEKKRQQWSMLVADDSPREYTVQVTYYTGEGLVVNLPAEKLTKKRFVVPAFNEAWAALEVVDGVIDVIRDIIDG